MRLTTLGATLLIVSAAPTALRGERPPLSTFLATVSVAAARLAGAMDGVTASESVSTFAQRSSSDTKIRTLPASLRSDVRWSSQADESNDGFRRRVLAADGRAPEPTLGRYPALIRTTSSTRASAAAGADWVGSPTAGEVFMQPAAIERSRWTLQECDVRRCRLNFQETMRPTLWRSATGADLPAHGTVTVDRLTGRLETLKIVASSERVNDGVSTTPRRRLSGFEQVAYRTTYELTVEFALVSGFAEPFPRRMSELYEESPNVPGPLGLAAAGNPLTPPSGSVDTEAGGNLLITSTATYANYARNVSH